MKTFSLLLLVLFFSNSSFATLPDELKREIIVMIKPQYMNFPTQETDAISIGSANITSQALYDVLDSYKVISIQRAFPDFTDSDTIRIIGSDTVKIPAFSRIFRIVLESESNVDYLIDDLITLDTLIGFAQKNPDIELLADPDYSKQWYLNNTGSQQSGISGADIRAEHGWQIYTGNSNIKVGILDAGINLNHEDLYGRISGESQIHSINHGNMMAGIIGGIKDNNKGIKGIDSYSQLISSSIYKNNPNSLEFIGAVDLATKIINLVNNGVKIINCSWRIPTPSGNPSSFDITIANAFAYATAMGCTIVGAMGNEGISDVRYPAYLQGVISVGATQNDDSKASFSNTGDWIDVVAPGGSNQSIPERNIWSTAGGVNQSTAYAYDFGTSLAAPIVTGIASILQGYVYQNQSKYLDVDDLQGIITSAANDVNSSTLPGWDNQIGYGKVNLKKSLDFLRSPYRMQNYSGTGYDTYTLITGWPHVKFITGVPSLPYGPLYGVKVYEVKKTVSIGSFNEKYVWGNGKNSKGWSNKKDIITGNLGFCEVVPGTITSNTVTLRTYCYEVWSWGLQNNGTYLGWYPSHPSNAVLKCTMLYKDPLAPEDLMEEETSRISNYPNPFNPVTKIKYSLANSGDVKILIYDITGREIKTLLSSYQDKGEYNIEFDGSTLNSGVFFCKIVSNDKFKIHKMLLIK